MPVALHVILVGGVTTLAIAALMVLVYRWRPARVAREFLLPMALVLFSVAGSRELAARLEASGPARWAIWGGTLIVTLGLFVLVHRVTGRRQKAP